MRGARPHPTLARYLPQRGRQSHAICTASPSRGSCRRSRLMRGLLSLCKASALCWILLVFGLLSGRAGPSFRFRPKGCKVRAEGGSVSSQHGYLMIPPLHSPKSPHQDISRPRGQGAFSCYVPNRKVILSFSAYWVTHNSSCQNVHENPKANRSLQGRWGVPGVQGGGCATPYAPTATTT